MNLIPHKWRKRSPRLPDYGIDVFIFDWYWYDDGPFFERGLDDGFLKAPNGDRINFSLMWANHDWIDIHPYKKEANKKCCIPENSKKKTFDQV